MKTRKEVLQVLQKQESFIFECNGLLIGGEVEEFNVRFEFKLKKGGTKIIELPLEINYAKDNFIVFIHDLRGYIDEMDRLKLEKESVEDKRDIWKIGNKVRLKGGGKILGTIVSNKRDETDPESYSDKDIFIRVDDGMDTEDKTYYKAELELVSENKS